MEIIYLQRYNNVLYHLPAALLLFAYSAAVCLPSTTLNLAAAADSSSSTSCVVCRVRARPAGGYSNAASSSTYDK